MDLFHPHFIAHFWGPSCINLNLSSKLQNHQIGCHEKGDLSRGPNVRREGDGFGDSHGAENEKKNGWDVVIKQQNLILGFFQCQGS